MTLSDAQLDRYARHIVLREIGGEGQIRLRAAHVAIVGAGGIGSPAIQYLAAAGIGRLTIIDDDRVSLSNLQRQILYGSDDVGALKGERAATRISALNPDTAVTIHATRLDANNAKALLEGADVALDGSDSFQTRLIVSDMATRLHIPLVSASVGQFDGQLGVYRGWETGQPCYRCLVGNDPDQAARSCAEDGVLGALAGVMGSLAALEAIRLVTGFGEARAGTLLRVDALTMAFKTAHVAKDSGCGACAA